MRVSTELKKHFVIYHYGQRKLSEAELRNAGVNFRYLFIDIETTIPLELQRFLELYRKNPQLDITPVRLIAKMMEERMVLRCDNSIVDRLQIVSRIVQTPPEVLLSDVLQDIYPGMFTEREFIGILSVLMGDGLRLK